MYFIQVNLQTAEIQTSTWASESLPIIIIIIRNEFIFIFIIFVDCFSTNWPFLCVSTLTWKLQLANRRRRTLIDQKFTQIRKNQIFSFSKQTKNKRINSKKKKLKTKRRPTTTAKRIEGMETRVNFCPCSLFPTKLYVENKHALSSMHLNRKIM